MNPINQQFTMPDDISVDITGASKDTFVAETWYMRQGRIYHELFFADGQGGMYSRVEPHYTLWERFKRTCSALLKHT